MYSVHALIMVVLYEMATVMSIAVLVIVHGTNMAKYIVQKSSAVAQRGIAMVMSNVPEVVNRDVLNIVCQANNESRVVAI